MDSKLLPPPPSPPAILLSTNLTATDTGNMNAPPPLLRSPRFQSPPLQHQKNNAKGILNYGSDYLLAPLTYVSLVCSSVSLLIKHFARREKKEFVCFVCSFEFFSR